jgi:2-(1,2-epoxy-1,2-dihydrophenyl)acetyl-CoA isomerase
MKTITFEMNQGVGTLTLNRPESLNALNPLMCEEIFELLSRIRTDPELRVLILTGAGGAFCAGGDVKAMGGDERTPQDRRFGMARAARLCTELANFDKPVIAAADGVAYGAGFSLLLLCDMVLVSSRIRLSMVFHRIGLIPDVGALYTLPRVVGPQKAKELIFSTREVNAEESLRLGIAMEVLEPDRLLDRAREIAKSLAGASPVALSLSKRALQASLNCDLTTMLEIEASGQALASTSGYTEEAARRFVSKEPPLFRWPYNK